MSPLGLIFTYFIVLVVIIAILYKAVLIAERDNASGDDYPVPSKHTDDD